MFIRMTFLTVRPTQSTVRPVNEVQAGLQRGRNAAVGAIEGRWKYLNVDFSVQLLKAGLRPQHKEEKTASLLTRYG